MMEHGVSISSSRFHKLAGVAYSTALSIFQKLTLVIESHMNGASVPSALFAPVLAKRSRETPARAHPLAEEEELKKRLFQGKTAGDSFDGQELINSSQSLPGFDCELDCGAEYEPEPEGETRISTNPPAAAGELNEQKKIVYECLSRQPVHFDDLCVQLGMPAGQLSATITMLELDGFVTRMAGDRYVRCTTGDDEIAMPSAGGVEPAKATAMVASFIEFVRSHFHAISRKYLQNYLAAHWCLTDRARWTRGSLLKVCTQFRHISYGEILDYVSPLSVRIFPCSQD
jgi:hypothetical protein